MFTSKFYVWMTFSYIYWCCCRLSFWFLIKSTYVHRTHSNASNFLTYCNLSLWLNSVFICLISRLRASYKISYSKIGKTPNFSIIFYFWREIWIWTFEVKLYFYIFRFDQVGTNFTLIFSYTFHKKNHIKIDNTFHQLSVASFIFLFTFDDHNLLFYVDCCL